MHAESRLFPLTKAVALGAVAALPLIGRADPANATASSASSNSTCPAMNFFHDWFAHVTQIQAEQPHWITPLVTVTPRLEQELRYDQTWQHLPGGDTLTSYGGGKGLEIIPADNVELIFGVPAWQAQKSPSGSTLKQGWTDENFLLKYRLLSANEEHGDYILTAFLGLSVPSGSETFSADHYIVTPTLAFGKGWGDFDFQTTFGVSVPDNGSAPAGAGTPILSNTAFQYRIMKNLWPELEVNYTRWPNGKHDDLDQLFLTPGLVIGRIPIAGRVGVTIGAGYQIAVTDHPLYRHNFILSARLPF